MGKKASAVRMTHYNRAREVLKDGGDEELTPTAMRVLGHGAWAGNCVGGRGGRVGCNGSAVGAGVVGSEELPPVAHAADAAHAADMQDDNLPGGDTSAALDDPGFERLMYASALM
jgi:hypothetical protein